MKNRKPFSLILICLCLITACSTVQEKSNQTENVTDTSVSKKKELTPEQQSAFDALNALQVRSDGHLYSTFANIEHPCFGVDTTFVISQTELLRAMEQLVSLKCKSLSIEEQKRLVAAAVLAQEKYSVTYCYDPTLVEDALMHGRWVLPAVLGRRDVVFEW